MKLFLKLLITASLVFVVYQSRWIFSFKYDPEYFENFYYESQYSYPQSARGISDGTLYKFVGYRLTQGENPFNINWEIPPFGKVLYGYSSRFFGNPYWMSALLYFSALIAFFVFLTKNFKNNLIPFFGVLMLILIPHFSLQLPDTMLDLPLTLAYLINLYFFFNYVDNKKISDLILSGVFLGLAATIKPPVYVPFILLSEILVAYLNERNWKKLFVLSVSAVSGYVLGYFVYFAKHPNPIPWLVLHKKIYDFYLGPKLNINYQSAIKEMFNLGTWGILYIIGLISYFISWLKYFENKKNLKLLTILLFASVFLVISSVIPFFPRYLLPLSLVFVYLILYIFKEKIFLLFLICLISTPFFYKSFVLGSADGDALATARFIETMADRELYHAINPAFSKGISEKSFVSKIEDFNIKNGVRKVQVTVGKGSSVDGKYFYNFKIIYLTRYGALENNKKFVYENVNNQWKLDWDWNYQYSGPINVSKNYTKSYEVYVIPRLMYDWNKNLDYLSSLTGIPSVEINKSLTSVVPDDFPKFVGYLKKDIAPFKENGAVRIIYE